MLSSLCQQKKSKKKENKRKKNWLVLLLPHFSVFGVFSSLNMCEPIAGCHICASFLLYKMVNDKNGVENSKT